jgi:hypothetical protein
MEVQCPRQCTSTGADGCAPLDGWMYKKKKFFLFIFNGHFLIIYFIYFPMVHSFKGGGCKDPLQPHAYLVIIFTFVYIVFFYFQQPYI